METELYLVTATTNEGIILREIFESKDEALLFEETKLKPQLREMYGDDIIQNNSLQLGFSMLELHKQTTNVDNDNEPNPYDTATYLKRLSESHCTPKIQNVLFEAAVLLCKQQDKIATHKNDRRLVNDAITEESLWWWQNDGEDYLQSLSGGVNVIISADVLRDIIKPELITSEISNVNLNTIDMRSLFDECDREELMDSFDRAMKIL